MASFGFASGNELEQMYQEVILEASKQAHGKEHFLASDAASVADASATQANQATQTTQSNLAPQTTQDAQATIGSLAVAQTQLHATHEGCELGQSHQFNPTCGDEVTVRVELRENPDGDSPVIEHLAWDGQGCSISQASLSIMVDLIAGKTVDEAMALFHDFHALMNSRGAGVDDAAAERLDDAIVFQGVSKYPMRIKCALLGWEGFKDSAAQAMSRM